MDNKKLSIITICYNEPNVTKTCDSIVNQTWQDFDWIVIDGGSSQDFLDKFEPYKKRINKFISEKDNGIYNAMNKGLAQATGDYVNFLNTGDMYFNNNVLFKIFENMKFSGEILYGTTYNVYPTSSEKNAITTNPDKIQKDFFILSNIQTPSMFIKRELFEKFGYFEETYKIASDRERWLDFVSNGVEFTYTSQTFSTFDMSGISSKESTQSIHEEEIMNILKKYYSEEYIINLRERFRQYLEQIQRQG